MFATKNPNSLADKFHIFGNTANTYIDIIQKNTLQEIEDKNHILKRQHKVENVNTKKTKKGIIQMIQAGD